MMHAVCLLCLFFIASGLTRTVAAASNTGAIAGVEFISAITEDADAGLQKDEKESHFLSTSCTDRCHVNYKGYRTIYQGKMFRHRSHSPEQGLQCDRCHSSDAVDTETHGRIIIGDKDCCKCHHKKKEKTPLSASLQKQDAVATSVFFDTKNVEVVKGSDNKICLKCHAVVKDYRDGIVKNSNVRKTPDWMSRSVSCTDCHKVDAERNDFMPVRDYCVECHNSDYGLLYDAWKDLFRKKAGQAANEGTHAPFYLKQIQKYGVHNFRLSKALLRTPDEIPNHD
ncbi:MAG: multiheme c-type cytochrome [Planctomycetota bacterium]